MSYENCILAGNMASTASQRTTSVTRTRVILRAGDYGHRTAGFALLQLNAKGFSKAMTQVVQYLAAKSIGNCNLTTRDRRHESRRAEHIPSYYLAAYTRKTYTTTILGMYKATQTRVKTRCELAQYFNIEVRLRQGSTLNQLGLLFIITSRVPVDGKRRPISVCVMCSKYRVAKPYNTNLGSEMVFF